MHSSSRMTCSLQGHRDKVSSLLHEPVERQDRVEPACFVLTSISSISSEGGRETQVFNLEASDGGSLLQGRKKGMVRAENRRGLVRAVAGVQSVQGGRG